MIIQQTTHIVFEYPQDYLQEQEWCKTKTDEWIHVGTDTRCSIYENKISYSIGQPNSSEKPNNCEAQTCDNCKLKGTTKWCDNQVVCRAYKPKDEAQTETETVREIIHKMIDNTELAEDAYPGLRQRLHDAVDEYEPQTDCAWR